ncbi:MAG: alpha/beta hydrolase [Cellvibrionaceae bacterium]|nr:alpha/beta hydrolase [Cellvibrionaceae bacterium]|tara:strand:- start:14274 stop:15146 length:873 start_codon:yes stop_codon:yes gene_type:complete
MFRVLFLLLSLAAFNVQAGLKDLQPMQYSVNGVSLAAVEVGNPDGEPVLMVMGLGSSYLLWGDGLIDGLVGSGYRVILFDNRDVGASQRMDHLGDPVIWWELLKNQLGFSVNTAYELQDMAADAVQLMDALEIDQAHVVGASMGGMIAQIIAYEYPQRVKSLTSIMSTSGAPHLPEPTDAAMESLQSASYATDEDLKERNRQGFWPQGVPRQMMAIFAAGDRSESVKRIEAKTLVLHGRDDGLLPVAHGEHTHQLIQESEMVIYNGMGHNLPADVVPKMVADIAEHIQGN